jgi:hypothetical protein
MKLSIAACARRPESGPVEGVFACLPPSVLQNPNNPAPPSPQASSAQPFRPRPERGDPS